MDSGINWVLFVIIGFVAGVSGKDIRAGKLSSIAVGILGACAGGSILEWSNATRSLLYRVGIIDYDIVVSLIFASLASLFCLFLLRLIKE